MIATAHPAHSRRRRRAAALAALLATTACTAPQASAPSSADAVNPIVHVEIPVTDMDRAERFYEAVFGFDLDRRTVDGYEMAFFPRREGRMGSSGALAKGDVYVPSTSGPIVYFDVPDIDPVLERARAHGAVVLYPKKNIGDGGFVAEFRDSEGNRIALNAMAD